MVSEGILGSFANLTPYCGDTLQLVAEYLHFVELGWMSGRVGG
jgi:hypothetical protein